MTSDLITPYTRTRAINQRAGASLELAHGKPAAETFPEGGTIFRGLAEEVIASFYIVAENGILAYVNPRFAKIFGYEAPEIIGRPILEFIADSEKAAVSKQFVAQMTGREPVSEFGSTLLHKDGGRVEILVHSALATFGGQKASLGVVVDVSGSKRAERQICEEGAKFRSVMEQNVAGIVIIRNDGTIGYSNGYFARMIGYTPGEIVGRPLRDFVPETEQQIIARNLRSPLLETGALLEIAGTMRARDGSLVEVLVNASKSNFEGESASIAVVVDVTERNTARRQVLSAAAMMAIEHESLPDGILVVDPQARIISVNGRLAEIFEIPPEFLAAGNEEPVLALALHRVIDAEAFQRRVSYLYDHPEESAHDEVVLKNGHILDRFTAPFKAVGGKYLGRIWVFHDVTERRKALESLRNSEERFRMLIEVAPDAILLFDYDENRLIATNKAAERLFGVPRDEILTRGLQHFYVSSQPDARPVAESYTEHGERALAGEEVTYERRIRQASGEERLCQVTLVRLPSNARLLRASFVDITERTRADAALRRFNRTLMTISATNAALVRAASEKELLDEMCRVAVETGGYSLAWIGFVEHDEARTIHPVAWAGEPAEFVQTKKATWAGDARGQGPTGIAVRTGEVQVVQNVATNPAMAPWRAEMLRYELKSSIALPLKNRSAVFGALTFYSVEPDAFDSEEVKLLKELAADLAYGISAQRDLVGREAALDDLQESLKSTVQAIATAVEMRDPYTAGHQRRVAELATAIAREIGLKEAQIEGLLLAATIHDVGKINIPAEILTKPGKLTLLEHQMLQTHVQTGHDIVRGVKFPWPIARIILKHHERLDGSGYPQGMKGDAILEEAKILAIADVVEAMMAHRPYRAALGLDAALAEIEAGKGLRYDPAAVEACVDLFRNKGFKFK